MVLKCLILLLLAILAQQQICQPNNFYNSDSKQCELCTSINQALCGSSTSTCPFYFWDGSSCVSCLSISNTDASVVSPENTQCRCAVSYYWVAESKTCQSCSNVATQSVCNSCSNVFNTNTEACLPCSSIANTIGKYNGNNGCLCGPGWTWSATSFSCVACSAASDQAACGVKSCGGFVWLQSVCTSCRLIKDANKYVLSPAGSCICLPGFAWDGSACAPCDAGTVTSDQCKQSSCSAFVWNAAEDPAACKDCGGIANTASSTPVNGQCACVADYYWDSDSNSCKNCQEATLKLCRKCQGFIWYQDKCSKCKEVTKADVSFSSYAMNGACICQQNYAWDAYTFTCVDCLTVTTPSKCGTGSCLHYFSITKTGSPVTITCSPCSQIPNTIPRQPSDITNPNVCSCAFGYVWATSTKQCVACNLVQGSTFDPVTGTCTNCNTKNSVQNFNYRDSKEKDNSNKKCQCSGNYVFDGKSCGCNNKNSFDLGRGKGCGPCSGIPGASSGPGKSSSGCSCSGGSSWNSDKSQCICTSPDNFMTTKGCVACSSIKGSSGQLDPNSPYQCLCSAGYVWDSLNNICACSDVNSVLKADGSCVSCITIPGSNGLRVGSNACGCLGANRWNATQFACACDPTLGIAINNICTPCSTIPGATKNASKSQCSCSSGRKWQSKQNKCICNNGNSCPCGTGNYQLPNTVKDCISCLKIPGASGATDSKGNCVCLVNFVWNAGISPSCKCQAGFVSDSASICVPCNVKNNALSALTSNTCQCLPNHIWNPATFQCDFTNNILGSQNYIKTYDGTLKNCEDLSGSTRISVDNFNCQCTSDSFWNNILLQCVQCNTVTYSTVDAANAFSCACNPGYAWDIFTFTCVPFAGSISLTQSSYITCSNIPFTTGATLINTKFPAQTILLSDDAAFATINSASPIYVAQKGYVCSCSSGYIWSESRKRCFASSLNATF